MIFTILKIIGLIILSLLGLILLAVLLLLFCPLRYSGKGNINNKDINANIKITWLLRLFGFEINFNENAEVKLRILFFKKRLFHIQNKLNEEDIAEENLSEEDIEQNCTDESIIEQNSKDIIDSTVLHVSSSEGVNSSNEKTENNAETVKNIGTEENDELKDKKRKNGYTKIKRICDSIINLCKRIKNFVDDPDCKSAFNSIKTELVSLLKSICPKKLKLQAKYSTGSPDTTGISLGILAMFPIGYQNRWQIEPDFDSDEFYIQGKFDIKGKIFFYKILRVVIRLFLDKNCRKLYNKLKS